MLTQSHRSVPKLGGMLSRNAQTGTETGHIQTGTHTDSHTQAWMHAHVPKLQGTETP